VERIKARAAKRSKTARTALERWWTGKYKLPLTDPSFQVTTEAALLEAFYIDMHDRRSELESEIADTPMEYREGLYRALRAVEAILNDTDPDDLMSRTGDPLIDKWLDELQAGRDPDLTEGLDPRFLRGE
jgi:hypothetical protein